MSFWVTESSLIAPLRPSTCISNTVGCAFVKDIIVMAVEEQSMFHIWELVRDWIQLTTYLNRYPSPPTDVSTTIELPSSRLPIRWPLSLFHIPGFVRDWTQLATLPAKSTLRPSRVFPLQSGCLRQGYHPYGGTGPPMADYWIFLQDN